MALNIKELKFPCYIGLESQYEHNVYNYLDEVFGKLGYFIKIKKTEYSNVDNCLVDINQLRCDAYIFNNKDKNPEKNLIALFELESNYPQSNLAKGIEQVNGYCQKLHKGYINNTYETANKIIKAIVYDGQDICVWDYNIENDTISQLIGNPKEHIGIKMTDDIKSRLLDLFPAEIRKEDDDSELKLIKGIKEDIRSNQALQANKSFLMTILAAIYGKAKKDTLEKSLQSLKKNKDDKEASGILAEWNDFCPKINYEKNKDTIDNKLYYKAKKLWVLSQNKKMDLYGFIYEELVEEKNKKDEGEFYTSRHLIKPIINSVFEKYLQKYWKIDADNIIDEMQKRKIVDPFCGSGGFLYELLRLLKQKYNLDNLELNKIAKSSMYGFDKNDIMAAFLNLYLIGDGETNLTQVSSTINWQNVWRYEIRGERAVLITNKEKLKNNIDTNEKTFFSFINMLIDWENVKKQFNIKLRNVNSIEEFYSFVERKERRNCSIEADFKLFYKLIEIADKSDCVLILIYNLLSQYSASNIIPTFDEFKNSLGAVDFLPTNIPYGPVNDVRFSTSNKGTLESLALKECIDLLKPSTYRNVTYDDFLGRYEDDANGEPISNNDGGIATIIVPNRLFEGGNERWIRDYLLERCKVLGVVKLPAYTFCPYATIQTFVITIQKKAVFEFGNTKQKQKCFFYIVDNDGKANSRNRYITNLISEISTPIYDKNNNLITNVHEYLHDELKDTIERYPEGYLSKLERAWIYGQLNSVNNSWNQKRYNEKWTGSKWEDIDVTELKWTYDELKIKTFEKQVEKKNKKASEIFLECIKEDTSFSYISLDEQKEIAINKLKFNYVSQIKEVTVKIGLSTPEKIKIFINPSKGIKGIKNIKKFIEENYLNMNYSIKEDKKEKVINIDMKNFTEYFMDYYYYGDLVSDIADVCKFIDTVEDIAIDEEEIKFYKTESFQQYNLVPEFYLKKKDNIMTPQEILENIKRLRNMNMEGENEN